MCPIIKFEGPNVSREMFGLLGLARVCLRWDLALGCSNLSCVGKLLGISPKSLWNVPHNKVRWSQCEFLKKGMLLSTVNPAFANIM